MFSPASLDLQPSGRQRWLVVGICAAALLAIALSGLPGGLGLIAALAVAYRGWRTWQRTVDLDHPASLQSLSWGPQGWYALLGDGRSYRVDPLPALVSEPLCILRLRFTDTGRVREWWLHPDSGDPEALRRLRVMLRMTSSAATRT